MDANLICSDSPFGIDIDTMV